VSSTTDIAECEARLRAMMDDQKDITGAVIASEDGHVLAAHSRNEMGSERVAAMSSSLVGLGATMAGTTGQSDNEYVIVQNTGGYVATLRLGTSHLLTVAAKTGINLGMLLSLARHAAEDLAGHVEG